MNRKVVLSVLACALAVISHGFAFAQIDATLSGDVRVTGDLDELPGGGNAGDENGGFTSLVVGINDGNVQNWALMGFDTTAAAGETITGATLTIGVQTGFGGGANHGSADDTMSIHELFATNAGWMEGSQGIQNNATNVAADGVVSFQNQAHGAPGTAVQWQDAAGASVDNFIGAFDSGAPVGTSVSGWISGEAPPQIVFEFDAATAQQWAAAGAVDLVLQVNDDGSNTSRFNLTNTSPSLEFTTATEVLLGDVDLSGDVSFLDIAPFIALLSSAGNFQAEADCNQDTIVSFLDIAPFIGILSGGTP